MRAKINRGKPYKAFADSGKAQALVTLTPNKKSVEQCREKRLPTHSFKLRLIRAELDIDIDIDVLITNLMDEQILPAHIFKELYHFKWGIEENDKRLKR